MKNHSLVCKLPTTVASAMAIIKKKKVLNKYIGGFVTAHCSSATGIMLSFTRFTDILSIDIKSLYVITFVCCWSTPLELLIKSD